MMFAATFTLLRTLPTLCSTPVATSAMPALREITAIREFIAASASCACLRSATSAVSSAVRAITRVSSSACASRNSVWA